MSLNLIGTWKSIYIINTKNNEFRYPVGLERNYSKSTLTLNPDGTAAVIDLAIMKLFKKRLHQTWEGDDSGFVILQDGFLNMVGEYNNMRYPFEALITYDERVQVELIYRRVSK